MGGYFIVLTQKSGFAKNEVAVRKKRWSILGNKKSPYSFVYRKGVDDNTCWKFTFVMKLKKENNSFSASDLY